MLYADYSVKPYVTDEMMTTCGGSEAARRATTRGMLTLDGSRSACDPLSDPAAPQRGILPPRLLPLLERTDYVANSNNTFWLTNPRAPITGVETFIRLPPAVGTADHRFATGRNERASRQSFRRRCDQSARLRRSRAPAARQSQSRRDHVFGTKLRFSVDAPTSHQSAAPTALQLFTLGIPCIYYGTEQALSGPEASERQWLPNWGSHDAYLREAMFGPDRGFPAFGAPGQHVFDANHPAYTRIATMNQLRKDFPVLRHGRQYRRQIATNGTFEFRGSDQLVAWSRILDDEEALCVVNTNGTATRSARVVVDASLNRPGDNFTVVLHTGDAAQVGGTRPVQEIGGTYFVEIRDLRPSEVVVLVNR
ncbi:MAG TPA: hypothetical protein VE010_09840 [Thermoanaerobaculia bacterium]|nr:hypothetical protein [Thermoanaerobaculia bacterium]